MSINKEIGLLWSRQSFGENTISDFKSLLNFQVKEKKLFKSVQKQRNYALIKNAKIVMFDWLLWSGQSFGESTISDFEFPSNFQVKERKKLFISVQKQRNWSFVVQTLIWGKYNIGFYIPIKFPSQRRKKIFKSAKKQ